VKHRPRKRFSQNFLVDGSVVAAIIEQLHVAPGDRIVEIGPGLGALTRPLLAVAGTLQAIEIDRDLAARLEHQFAPRLKLHFGDVLKFDFGAVGDDLRVIGNLPYHISTPVLFHVARFCAHVRDMHFMLQKEVVARITAAASTPDYGRLSVMLQYRFEAARILDVPASAFEPMPTVESAVVRLTPRRPLSYPARDEALFARVVAAAFAQRRKTLRNSVRGYVTADQLVRLGIAPSARAQELSVAQFVAVANASAPSDP
jgi:16S rRNA (adenine1518-N6/adenine1519-N6)-dimethyltransferase